MAEALTHAAGNFYINDKPRARSSASNLSAARRASGTNDKAGSYLNLVRWTKRAHDQRNVRSRLAISRTRS
jgi:1-pyrroline-5-carboxylate dehydrogenase